MSEFVFVADMFAEQYAGGAELTTRAIMQGNKNTQTARKVNCNL